MDGWSRFPCPQLNRALRQLADDGMDVTMDALRKAGLGDDALTRVIVIDFGSDAASFELLAPKGYVFHGQWVAERHMPVELR